MMLVFDSYVHLPVRIGHGLPSIPPWLQALDGATSDMEGF